MTISSRKLVQGRFPEFDELVRGAERGQYPLYILFPGPGAKNLDSSTERSNGAVPSSGSSSSSMGTPCSVEAMTSSHCLCSAAVGTDSSKDSTMGSTSTRSSSPTVLASLGSTNCDGPVTNSVNNGSDCNIHKQQYPSYCLLVIDGTWRQAREMFAVLQPWLLGPHSCGIRVQLPTAAPNTATIIMNTASSSSQCPVANTDMEPEVDSLQDMQQHCVSQCQQDVTAALEDLSVSTAPRDSVADVQQSSPDHHRVASSSIISRARGSSNAEQPRTEPWHVDDNGADSSRLHMRLMTVDEDPSDTCSSPQGQQHGTVTCSQLKARQSHGESDDSIITSICPELGSGNGSELHAEAGQAATFDVTDPSCRLRTQPWAGCMTTFEAVARAVAVLEEKPCMLEPLLQPMRLLTQLQASFDPAVKARCQQQGTYVVDMNRKLGTRGTLP
eukprot:jgi/Chrzof1/7790/Cz02g36240.t1